MSPTHDERLDECWHDLAYAIVVQAANDYREHYCNPKELDRFFRSEYYRTLTNVDGEMLIQKLRKEWNRMKVTLIQATPKPVETIAKIASICYGSDPKNPMGLVKHLYKNGHHSVFEHIYFTFKIEGISRACSHQLVRHRHCSFTQRSQRYCHETGLDVVIPDSIGSQEESWNIYMTEMAKIADAYNKLTKREIPNEDARYLLANACETELYLSCNLRELIHIANERLCTRAQWEIRACVREMCNLVDPNLQFMLVPKCKSGRIICPSPCTDRKEENA